MSGGTPSQAQLEARPLVLADFSIKADGAAPVADDNGHASLIRYTVGQNPPKLVSGKLVADPTANTAYATYFQIAEPSGQNFKAAGARFTVPANDAGATSITLALWDHDFTPVTGNVPQARAHFVVIPGTASWTFYVCDGSGHLVQVATGTFAAPAYDNTAEWAMYVFVDEDSGNAILWLPDSSIVTVTAAAIASTIGGTVGWTAGATLKSLTGKVATVEHFAANNALANAATFPQFIDFWAESTVLPRSRRTASPAALVKSIQATKPDTKYTNATLVNGWASGTQPLQYRKFADGKVHIRGFAQSGAVNTTAFTLPIGYRPPYIVGSAGVSGGGAFAWLLINPDGTVVPETAGMWIDAWIDTTL